MAAALATNKVGLRVLAASQLELQAELATAQGQGDAQLLSLLLTQLRQGRDERAALRERAAAEREGAEKEVALARVSGSRGRSSWLG